MCEICAATGRTPDHSAQFEAASFDEAVAMSLSLMASELGITQGMEVCRREDATHFAQLASTDENGNPVAIPLYVRPKQTLQC